MEYRKLPKEKFGELIATLYAVQCNIRIESFWDSGYAWDLGDDRNGFLKLSEQGAELRDQLIANEEYKEEDVEMMGGLIMFEYMHVWTGIDTKGNRNQMYRLLDDIYESDDAMRMQLGQLRKGLNKITNDSYSNDTKRVLI